MNYLLLFCGILPTILLPIYIVAIHLYGGNKKRGGKGK